MRDKTTETTNETRLEQALAEQFQNLRRHERSNLPDFPTETSLRQQQAMSADTSPVTGWAYRSDWRTMPRIAAALVLVAFTGFLFSELTTSPEQGQDAAEIYSQIMQAHEGLSTDGLLMVSDSLSPEMAGHNGFYDIDLSIEFETELYAN